MINTQGLFIVGTDTGVGKTLIACSIIRMLREQVVDAVGFKPVATGEVDGSWGDAEALFDASGGVEPIERVCPFRFALPLAPVLAARAEGIEPDLSLAQTILVQHCRNHDCVIIEGVGGLLVPLDVDTLVVDLAARLGFPVLVVCRAALGTINHTLLTIRELERHKLPIAGIVMNVTNSDDAAMALGAREEIERVSKQKIVAVIPYLGSAPTMQAPQTALVARATASLAQQVDVRKLLGSEGRAPAKKPAK